MKILMVAMALFGLAAAADAEDYECKSDDGCTARITVDGVVEEHAFRKGDIVSTEAGWVVMSGCGWVKLKTKDYAPNTPPRPQVTVLPMLGTGTTLTVGGRQWTGLPQAFTGTPGNQGDVFSMSWKHDSDGPGPRQPATVTVETERRSGETIREHARRFQAMCDEMQELFPPNVPETP